MKQLRHWLRAAYLVLVLACGLSEPSPCDGQMAVTYHDHADQALRSFLLKFWNGGQQYLKNTFPDSGSLTGYWTYANGWDAVMDGVERTLGQQYSGLIETFYLGQNERGWFAGYYDDECWMTLALIRAYDLTGDTKYLSQAQVLYADIMAGWDTTCCGANKGGMWWDKAHTQKATAANAGTALAGTRLYRRTQNATYLSFAQQVYSFWYANMVNASTFQVCDHINPDGTKVWWRFTYNEGLMIGAGVELSEATSNSVYLTNAHNIARFMVNNEVTATGFGSVLFDGANADCGGDCHQFKGPAYRYLSRLYAKDTSKVQYYSVLKASADALWSLARNTTSTVFSVNWAGPAQSAVDQGQQNAATAALNRFALLYGPYPATTAPYNQYEAENAVLHHVQFEATYGSFSGWGYVAAWNGDGQGVDFKVTCYTAGAHTLVFRYAAGAGNASRAITVNGAVLAANQGFPTTGNWSAYSTLSIPCNLPLGTSIVSLVFDSARSNSNWLNLDNLLVTGDAPEEIRVTGISPSPTGNVHLTWTTRSGQRYRAQSASSLGATNWNDVGTPVFATGATASLDDRTSPAPQRFYRVAQP